MTVNTPDFWSKINEDFQNKLTQSWGQALQAFQTMDLGGIVPPDSSSKQAAQSQLKFEPEKLQKIQMQYLEEAAALWNGGLSGKPELKDRRFSAEAWTSNPVASFTAGTYLLNSRTMLGQCCGCGRADSKQNPFCRRTMGGRYSPQ